MAWGRANGYGLSLSSAVIVWRQAEKVKQYLTPLPGFATPPPSPNPLDWERGEGPGVGATRAAREYAAPGRVEGIGPRR